MEVDIEEFMPNSEPQNTLPRGEFNILLNFKNVFLKLFDWLKFIILFDHFYKE